MLILSSQYPTPQKRCLLLKDGLERRGAIFFMASIPYVHRKSPAAKLVIILDKAIGGSCAEVLESLSVVLCQHLPELLLLRLLLDGSNALLSVML